MDAGILVSTHLSSLYPTQATAIPVHTARHDTPLPSTSQDADQVPEHASCSSILNSPNTGTILLRVLHGGLIIELISLSTDVSPLRFVFPATVLAAPAIFTWESTELHVLAVTNVGSLYRLVIPIGTGRSLWKDHMESIWIREYLIKIAPEQLVGPVHAQGIHCVAVGLAHGALLRIESDTLGLDEQHDEWIESTFQHSSFLSSLTSLLPTQSATANNASDIVAMASIPWPTDIGHIWSLSRDRTLRLWKAKTGCVSSKTLSIAIAGRDSSPTHQLLDGAQQNLLRVFEGSSSGDQVYLLAFMPTISSSTSGGMFRLVSVVADHLQDLGAIECSSASAHSRLQDFMIVDDSLYILWDHQGQSLVERTVINVESFSDQERRSWHAVFVSPEPEHSPGYLEKLLLSPGSVVEKGLEAVLRPGAFSINTLRSAIDEYTDSCLSLPGNVPPQLTSNYGSIAENIASVVGCTVKLVHDTQTGAPQYASYWSSMKRDWEGFISRCSRLERLGSRPLAISVEDQGNIIIVERERVRSLTREDLPLYLRRLLSQENSSIDSQYDILSSSWILRSTLNPQVIADLENRLNDLFQQGITFTFSDIIQDQASRSRIFEYADDGTANWVLGRLQSIDDLDAAARAALDVIGGLDMEVKREEDEVELLLPSTNSHWLRATTASYIAATVHARYELCLSLVVLLYFLASDLIEWDPSLLGEVLAVFRGVAMLRLAEKQLGPGSSRANGDDLSSEDVVVKMRNMNVSPHKLQANPSYSLIHHLLAQSDHVLALPGAAHRFLDSSGLLQSVSPAHATKFEVLFCERLRLCRCYGLTREMLSWLPKTPGVSYAQARLWLDTGRVEDASELLRRLAGCFGPDAGVSPEDQEALAAVLPAAECFNSEFTFYSHAAELFRQNNLVNHEVRFARLAISAAPGNTDTSSLWLNVIKGYTELGMYESAYTSLMSSPYDKLKRECVSHLTYRMCEDNAVEKLLTFNFAGISDEVEGALSFKARNVDPRVKPCYAKILYAWYTGRGNHRNAALAMYHRAHKLRDLIVDAQSFAALAEEQLQAYAVAINSLSLVEQHNAWIVLPAASKGDSEPRKRRRLTEYIPEAKYAAGRHEAEVVQLSDIQYDHSSLSAQVDLVRADPASLTSEGLFSPSSLVILKLAQMNRFNQAMTYARNLKIDMTDLFTHLTRQCLRLSQRADAVIQEDATDWLFSEKSSSSSGSPANRGWRYLRQALQLYDGPETDYKYTKATLETLLGHDRKRSPPPWIIHVLEEYNPEFLIRTSMRYENHGDAIEYSLSLLRKINTKLIRETPQNASSTWLPYTLLDQVLAASKSLEQPPPSVLKFERELLNHVKRVHKLINCHRTS
ncbi:hypothetical protein AX17_001147 [Amanita inopinata Kibby_2008]|nr:hypothetical protein AX17_001147 [Amanita inopinata Kibby_2008]